MKLEELKKGMLVEGILSDGAVTLRDVEPGDGAVEVIFKDASGGIGKRLLFRSDEPNLKVVREDGEWRFDGNGARFRLAAEARRIGSAYLFDSLLKPSCRIEPAAMAVHDHTAKSLSGAPCFFAVYPDLLDVLYGRRVVVYNASYDRRVWDESIRRLRARGALADGLPSWECAMRQYARFVGERTKRGGCRNQKLTGGNHTALGDALATVHLIERMTAG